MFRISPIIIGSMVLFAAPLHAEIDVGASQLGFGYCPPPVVPGCIAQSATRRPSRPALEACRNDVFRFTQSLGAYRACLTRESERAIGTGNAAIDRFRCIAQGGRGCK